MKISGHQRALLDHTIQAILSAANLLMDQYPSQAMEKVMLFGKPDTLTLDAIPEILVNTRLGEFDERIPLITEENGISYSAAQLGYEIVMIADPTDRSKQLASYFDLMRKRDDNKKISEQLRDPEVLKEWVSIGSGPVEVTGATIAVSCVHNKQPLFAVILNYVTNVLYVACPTGVHSLDISTMSDEELSSLNSLTVSGNGTEITFPSVRKRQMRGDALFRFTTFTQKSGYPENLNDCMVFIREPLKHVVYDAPGGPTRVLYLSSVNVGEKATEVGFILANGEKITEWMHWLPFIRFSTNQDGGPALKLFEVSIERPWTKDGILMSTLPDYSIFQKQEDGGFQLDMQILSRHQNPSRYRSMLVVTPHDNERVANLMVQRGYREIVFP